MISALLLCAAARIVDGDTISCSSVGRVRMASIDAPDKTSSLPCREHYGDHVCDNAKAALATEQLKLYTFSKRITFRILGYDSRNHRPVAQMFAADHDLQCYMLHQQPVVTSPNPDDHVSGAMVYLARYMPTYDRQYGYPILHRCPITVRKAWR